MFVTLVLSCICIGVNASIGRRLDTVEIRLDAIEMRVLTDKALLRTMEETIETLNNSVSKLEENVCLISDMHRSSNEDKSPSASTDSVKLEKYIIAGSKYEKRWLRNEVQSFRNTMDDMDKQMRSKFEQLESSVNNISRKTEELKNYEININSLITKTEKQLNDQTHSFISELARVKTDFLENVRNVTEHLYSKMNETDKHIRGVLANIEIQTKQLHININETHEKLKKVTDDLAYMNRSLICKEGWINLGSFCYLFVEKQTYFDGAKAECSKFNAYVAVPESSPESDFIYSLKTGGGNSMWIGISDQEKEGVWKSVRTGNVISYTNVDKENLSLVFGEDQGISTRGYCFPDGNEALPSFRLESIARGLGYRDLRRIPMIDYFSHLLLGDLNKIL